ncbi:hypothetical protein GM921_12065 [Pedobacter sp. LMG 31464]|uniref:Uncharacterized protein n=1 Tax=Pedobacter planticolens TaxID=2679964 RepID=A0A923DY72_9SPHI|nr:hypothetical protein [Pedobacter planticolens]MBB2146226.1 hypothetical protein [Pedobacter planticolens]
MEYLKSITPFLFIIGLYLISFFIQKLFKLETAIKIRILIGCIGIGVYLCLAFQAESLKTTIVLTLLSGTILYGVVSLMNKYLDLKD